MDAVLFVVSTPYQLLGAIAIQYCLTANVDIYLVPNFEVENIARRLKNIGIFRDVRICNDRIYDYYHPKNRILLWWRMVKSYFFLSESIDKFMLACNNYTAMYYSYCGAEPGLFSAFFLSRGTRLNYYDDGEGSYNCKRMSAYSQKQKVVRYVFCGSSSVNYKQQWWLYFPGLYHILHPKDNKLVKMIPKIWIQPEIQKMVTYLFDVSDNDKVKGRIVLLDIVHNETLNNIGEQELDDIYSKIFGELGRENVLIKKHPRDKKAIYEGCRYSRDAGVPFEVLTIGEDMNQKLLISNASTSMVLPKIMKDEEPYVLLLYKLISGYKSDFRDKDIYYGAVKKLYRNPEKFMIPETMDELDECLQILKNEFRMMGKSNV